MAAAPLGWLGIVRLGLVKTALGAIVVLTTTTINRVMVVELALPVMLPGALVAFHYALQVLRPQIGHGSDVGGRRTPWIIGGMAVLAAGGVGAAIATAWMSTNLWAGIALAVVAFGLVGLGVAGAGTSLLVLLALRVAPRRRPAAATIVWIMMIAGFAIAPTVAGRLLDPYSPSRLVAVTAGVSGIAFLLAVLAVWGVEGRAPATAAPGPQPATRAAKKSSFREAFAEVWREPHARLFAIFIAVSMLAYSGQELILEPFAGTVFGLTLGATTSLAGLQHGGSLLGMVLIAVAGSVIGGEHFGSMRGWTIAGCAASAAALAGMATAGAIGPAWPLQASFFGLGVANGIYAAAAVASMMQFAAAGRETRGGVRMGLFGASQALAFGAGGFIGTVSVDLARSLLGSAPAAYGIVFASQAVLFLLAAWIAARMGAWAAGAVPAAFSTVAPGDGAGALPSGRG
jgi:BCD family chlorophyll transporter-like MFS transporter